MKILIPILGILGIVFTTYGIVALCQAQDNMREPWTTQAATFNPVGVKYNGGITTGNELSCKTPAMWSYQAEQSLNKDFGK